MGSVLGVRGRGQLWGQGELQGQRFRIRDLGLGLRSRLGIGIQGWGSRSGVHSGGWGQPWAGVLGSNVGVRVSRVKGPWLGFRVGAHGWGSGSALGWGLWGQGPGLKSPGMRAQGRRSRAGAHSQGLGFSGGPGSVLEVWG